MNDKIWKGVAAVALVIAVIGVFTPQVRDAVTGYVGTRFPNGLEIGTSGGQGGLQVNASTTQVLKLKVGLSTTGTTITAVNSGLCYIYPYAASITASSTALFDCQGTAAAGTAGAITALPGVQANDNCQLQLSTTTAVATYPTVRLAGASASTTNGYITGRLVNDGGAYTWPINTNATGTATYICTRS